MLKVSAKLSGALNPDRQLEQSDRTCIKSMQSKHFVPVGLGAGLVGRPN